MTRRTLLAFFASTVLLAACSASEPNGCVRKEDCGDGLHCVDGVCQQLGCSCEGRICGDDGCGNSCGECQGNLICQADGQCLADDGDVCAAGADCVSGSCNGGQCDPSCSENNGGCDAKATCANTPTSRTCTCPTGLPGNGLVCSVPASCATDNGGCHAQANCFPVGESSRTCVCKPGFLGDGTTNCVSFNAGLQPGSPSPTFKVNPWRNGQSAYLGPQTNAVKWTVTLDSGVEQSTPVIAADGTIYVRSARSLNALRPDGTIKWKLSLVVGDPSAPYASPTIGADGTVYLADGEGKLLAVNPDKSIKWTFDSGATYWRNRGAPMVAGNGTIFFGDELSYLAALTPEGARSWTFTPYSTFAMNGSPALATDGTLFAGNWDSPVQHPVVYAVLATGAEKWSTLPEVSNCGIRGGVAISPNGQVVGVGSFAPLMSLDASTGEVAWTWNSLDEARGNAYDSPSVTADGTIVFVGGLAANEPHVLFAVTPAGSFLWKLGLEAGNSYSSTVIGADGTIYVGSGKTLFAVGPDGQERWSLALGADVDSTPVIGEDGILYVATRGAKVFAVGP